MAGEALKVVIGANPPSRLDKALARDVPEEAVLSRTRLARLIAEGQVSRNGTVLADAKLPVSEGDVIDISLPEAVSVETVAEDLPLDVVFEDDDLAVINKPAGLVVHPAPGAPRGTLVNALLHHFGEDLSGVGGEKRPGIVHRIDKDTSGLLVVAKSDRAHQGLARQFEAHTAERTYLALCHGLPDQGDPRLRGLRGISFEGPVMKITTGLDRHRTDRQRQAVTFEGGRRAVTRVKVLRAWGQDLSLVECRLETGRTHQIRVHLAYAGLPLIGDQTYGGRRKVSPKFGDLADRLNSFPRQALHAASLGFEHPVSGENKRFSADLPSDLAGLLAELDGTL
jgi:23S rRNA pseudouridine1911/1915/1917 synthase